MTTQKSFKRRVRERMEKTGESYTAAREQLIPSPQADPEPPTRVEERMGRALEAWFEQLDADGAGRMTHKEIARHLQDVHGVEGWWAQKVTVAYERARGRRAVNQRADGFCASVSKTVHVPVDVLYAAVEARLPEWELSLRRANPPKSLRTDAQLGRPVIGFADRGDRSVVAVSHERLPDAAAVGAAKALWRERLTALADQLASSGEPVNWMRT